jgi:hypothetical protein
LTDHELWEKFALGDIGDLSSKQLRHMARQAKAGQEYLAARKEWLAHATTCQDLYRIEDALKSRRDEHVPKDRRPRQRPIAHG